MHKMKLMMINQMALHQKPTINLSRLNDIKAVNQSARPNPNPNSSQNNLNDATAARVDPSVIPTNNPKLCLKMRNNLTPLPIVNADVGPAGVTSTA